MTIPSGSGSETVNRATVKATGAAWTTIRWDQAVTAQGNTATGTVAIPTDVIVSILNITCCDQSGSQIGFALTVDIDGTADIYYLSNGATLIPANGTFVYSDTIILRPTDKLKVYSTGAAHFIINFVYQDWT
jgi:hypothetical protein